MRHIFLFPVATPIKFNAKFFHRNFLNVPCDRLIILSFPRSLTIHERVEIKRPTGLMVAFLLDAVSPCDYLSGNGSTLRVQFALTFIGSFAPVVRNAEIVRAINNCEFDYFNKNLIDTD